MFPTQLLKGRWYYSASVFALWTLSSPELTLHQISGLGCYEASAEIFALGRAPFSLNRLRGLLMHFYFFMCRTIFQWRQAGMKGQKQRMITCKKKEKSQESFWTGTQTELIQTLKRRAVICPKFSLPEGILPPFLTTVWVIYCLVVIILYLLLTGTKKTLYLYLKNEHPVPINKMSHAQQSGIMCSEWDLKKIYFSYK